MNRVYLHSGEKESSLVKLIFLLLMPFLIYGFYKNGFYLYHKNLISLPMMFKPLYFFGISVIISLFFDLIKKRKMFNYYFLGNIIISLIAMPNMNVWVYLGVVLFLNIILCFLNYNAISLFMIISWVVALICKNYTFLNAFEASFEHKYSLLNYLLGKGQGGISNTFLVFCIISLIVLCFKFSYKKHIPLVTLITFYILLTIYSFINGSLDLNLFMNNNFVFAVIFIAPLTMLSPYTKGGCFLYGILLGILSFVISFIDLNIGIYFIIMLMSSIYFVFDKLFCKKIKR